MKILMKSKNKSCKTILGRITSRDFSKNLKMDINYQSHPELFTEIQKIILKYYDLEIQSGGKVNSKVILKRLKNKYKPKLYGLSYVK